MSTGPGGWRSHVGGPEAETSGAKKGCSGGQRGQGHLSKAAGVVGGAGPGWRPGRVLHSPSRGPPAAGSVMVPKMTVAPQASVSMSFGTPAGAPRGSPSTIPQP